MKMWLDDIRPMPENYDICAHNYNEAIEILKTGKVSFVSFDHDLGRGKTGYDIAKWVEEAAYNRVLPPFKWRIHSANFTGGVNIFRALCKADDYWDKKNENSNI